MNPRAEQQIKWIESSDLADYSAWPSLFEAFAVSTLIAKERRDEKLLPVPHSPLECLGFCFFCGETVMSSVFFLSELWSEGGRGGFFSTLVETLGPGGEPFALPGSLFKEITQSPHLCCIMGPSERPRTPDVPARRHTDGFFDTRVNTDGDCALFFF